MRKSLFIFLLVSQLILSGQFPNFYGSSGLLKIPSARVIDQRSIAINFCKLKDNFVRQDIRNVHNQWGFMISIGLLPGLESAVRLTGIPDLPDPSIVYNYYIDRSLNVKYSFNEEGELLPVFAFGVQDIFGKLKTKKFNSTYLVLSKKLDVSYVEDIDLTLGYGSDIWDEVTIESGDHRFIGFFGGIEINIWKYFSIISEYDAENFNYGFRMNYKNYIFSKFFINNDSYLNGLLGFSFSI